MKKLMIACCVFGLCGAAAGQQRTAPKKAAPTGQAKARQLNAPAQNSSVRLVQTDSHQARAAINNTQRLTISDPVIRAFNMRSNGVPIRLSGSGVLGSPRGTYGFANGQISLRTTDATSHGGVTGMGSVGTGSSVGSIGTGSLVPLVNGKNVYSGPGMWGSARNLQLPDSVLRRRPGE